MPSDDKVASVASNRRKASVQSSTKIKVLFLAKLWRKNKFIKKLLDLVFFTFRV